MDKETELEVTYCTDEPSNRDYKFEEYEQFINNDEYGKGINSMRPDNVKVWNQGNTPACTCYSMGHVSNWENLLEDIKLWTKRDQKDPSVLWNRFCAMRNNYSTGTSIQIMADFYRKQWEIEWYVTINNSDKDIVAKMKKSLDGWYFLSTGSSNGDWSAIKKTWIYTIRADGKYVGHAWCIVDYGDGFFWAVNSYGDKRWPYNGMFKVPFDMVTKIYNKLCIIDKDDSGAFTNLKLYKKAQEMVSLAKELYNNGNKEQKQYFEQIMLWKNIERLYSV